MDRAQLAARLELDEGKKPRMYLDTVGCWTAGVGRNLSERAFSEDEIQLMLKNDIAIAESALDRNCPWWRTMSEARQQALANMCFQMGISKLLGFKKMLVMLEAGRWDAAALEAMDSKWAQQAPNRARRVTQQLREG